MALVGARAPAARGPPERPRPRRGGDLRRDPQRRRGSFVASAREGRDAGGWCDAGGDGTKHRRCRGYVSGSATGTGAGALLDRFRAD